MRTIYNTLPYTAIYKIIAGSLFRTYTHTMFIVECLPLNKSLNKESLSYFSSKRFEAGSIIKVPLRNKSVSALVLGWTEAMENKSEIKSAPYFLKKINSNINSSESKPFLKKEFIEATKLVSEFFACGQGAVLEQVIPSFFLENQNTLNTKKGSLVSSMGNTKKEVRIIQGENEERIMHYKSITREEFARKKSVFICLPQNEQVKQLKEKLEKGIEQFTCIFHKDMKKNELNLEIKKVLNSEHPLLIIATAKWLFLPRFDLGTIIIERENSSGWKTLNRPFIDLRFFAEKVAEKIGARTIIGDSFLRTETIWRYKQGEISEFESVKWRIPIQTEPIAIEKNKPRKIDEEFNVLDPILIDHMKQTLEDGGNVFLYATRKGLSPTIICRDCGEQVRCNNCESPVILYKLKEGAVFRCHQCGERRDALEVCKNCGSWKLANFGGGVDKVTEEVKKIFDNYPIFEINKDVCPTNTKVLKVVDGFYKSHKSILIGTELALPFMHKKVSLSCLTSFDTLFSIPDFRIREKIFNLILDVRSLSKNKFIIQSRNLEDSLVKNSLSGNLLEFYRSEISDREELSYPPFSIFIKITLRGNRQSVDKGVRILAETFKEERVTIFSSIHEKKGEQAAVNGVIKVSRDNWPDKEIISKIESLPLQFEIKVDPDNLL